jgi:hypothetical protein
MRRAILILADGLRPDVAEEELAAGNLPALAALTAEGGRGRAITVFPSTTSVAYLPFLTGRFPGHCNIPSIRWLDRQAYGGRWWRERRAVRSYCGYQAGMLDDDVSGHVQTIFQLVPESIGLFTMITRGLTPERDPAQGSRKFWGSVSHATEWHQPGDDRVARGLLAAVRQDWRFIFAQFPAVDGYTHGDHPRGPKVLGALRTLDGTIARMMQVLQMRGEFDDTLIALVSDHGSSVMHTHLDLADWFRGQGVPTLSHPILWERNPRAAVMVAGNASAGVYARPGVPRAKRWPLAQLRQPDAFGTAHDVVARLAQEPAVAFVAGEDGRGGIALLSREGEATVSRHGDTISYATQTGDPLQMGGAFSGDRDAWLAHSFDSAFPEAPVHLCDQFASRRAADLLVIANEGFDFRKRYERPEHKSGHGSLIRVHMQTPLWSNQLLPTVPLRTADVFPALLAWLGVAAPEGIDGRAVWLPDGRPDAWTPGRDARRLDCGSARRQEDALRDRHPAEA